MKLALIITINQGYLDNVIAIPLTADETSIKSARIYYTALCRISDDYNKYKDEYPNSFTDSVGYQVFYEECEAEGSFDKTAYTVMTLKDWNMKETKVFDTETGARSYFVSQCKKSFEYSSVITESSNPDSFLDDKGYAVFYHETYIL